MKLAEDVQTDDFVRSLVEVRGEALERGDIVYEVMTDGRHAKLRKFRVMEATKSVAKVVDYDGSKSGSRGYRTIRLGDLRMERPQKTAKVTTLRPNSEAACSHGPAESEKHTSAPSTRIELDGDDDAIVQMAREHGRGIRDELRALAEQKIKLMKSLEDIDANHRKSIEAIERELSVAKEDHESDRALVARQLDSLNGKIERVNMRKSVLRQVIDEI